MSSERDTIFALSSGRPPAAIAVVRICGPRAGDALKRLTGRLPEPRKMALARVRDPLSGEVIDEAVALWFPGPHSETGEDMAELQLHGGRAVVAAVLRSLGSLEGLRPAEAGEFTRRAFENGKLSLTAVEGLADLVSAETEAQRRQAYRQLKGLLGDRAEVWRARLIEALALVEARIDFPDEADVPEDLIGPAMAVARNLRNEIAGALSDARHGERLRDGLVVAIAGPPNVGKSTLLNRIARREAAIVSPVAGTTRDVIEVHLDLGGYPVTLLDTAGIRDSDDPVEQEGVRRAQLRSAEADLVVWVEDAREIGQWPSVGRDDASSISSSAFMVEQHRPMAEQASGQRPGPDRWLVLSKADLVPDKSWQEKGFPAVTKNKSQELNFSSYTRTFVLSAQTGEGVDRLLAGLCSHAEKYFGAEPSLVARQRHAQLLHEAISALDRALSAHADDLKAEELRMAARSLGRLTGRVDVEDVLDAIFSEFCIGK